MKTSRPLLPLLVCALCLIPGLHLGGSDHSVLSKDGGRDAPDSYCPVPGGLTVSDIETTSADVHWDPVYEAHSYSVQIRTLYGSWDYVPGSPFMSTWVSIYGLDPGTTYEVRVRSNCSYGEYSSWSYPVSFTTEGTGSCDTPTGLVTLDITQTTATFDWNSVNGASSYDIQWRYPGGYWNTLVNSWPYSSVSVSGLHPATDYEWRVRANCGYGNHSEWSYPESFTTLGSSCHTPTQLYTTDISSTQATLNWDPVSGAESYSVQYRASYQNWQSAPGSPFSGTSATLYNLEPGTSYEWRVRANCGYGNHSYWSDPESFYTSGSSCHAPTHLWTSNISGTSATLNWDPVSGAETYSVQFRSNYQNWEYVPGSPFTGTSVTLSNLEPGIYYEWRVLVSCGYGNNSDWSYPQSFYTSGSSCHAPHYLWTSDITGTSATLNWEAVAGAQTYSVEYRSYYQNWQTVPGSPFTGTSVTLNNLDPGTHYEWRVRANCGSGNYSYWSDEVVFTTTGSGSCDPPSGLHTYQITHTTAIWDWSPVSGAYAYSVQWRYPGGSWHNLQGGPWPYTQLHIGGLQPATTYEWRVRSHCSYGNYSDWSDPTVFTTLGTVCHAPDELMTTNVTNTGATLSWSSVAGAESYSVQIRQPNGYWSYIPGSPFNDTSVTINYLTPGTEYAWRVRANCDNWYHSSWSYPEYFTTTGSSSCTPPDSLYETNVSAHLATLNWTEVPGAWYYFIQYRVVGGTWHTIVSPWFFFHYHLGDLEPNTTYEWRVSAKCSNGETSDWSPISTFTTPGISTLANDHCDDAITLTVNDTCLIYSASNVSATPSFLPPEGTCPDDGYKDVWFRFTMPNSSYPAVTIRTLAGTLTDAVMEIYIGHGCMSKSYLICEDNNENGNGSLMPVVNLLGGAGVTVWVRVWGKDGAEGTFDICVLDFLSDDLQDDVTTIEIPGSVDTPADISAQESDVADPMESVTLTIAPNPVSDILRIGFVQTDESIVTGLVLTDMSGRVAMKRSYTEGSDDAFHDQIDVSGLAPGTYVLHVQTTSDLISEKILVVR